MTITIEQLQLDELNAFLHIQAEDAFPDLKDEKRLKMLACKWHEFAEFCTFRDNDNRLAGMIAFYANQPKGGVAYISHVYVSKGYRGQGIFTKLIDTVVEFVKERDFCHIRLEVHKNNLIAQKAYQNYGFIPVGNASETSIYMNYNIS